MTPTREIIGMATCIDGTNPAPGSTGWKITTGSSYRVLEQFSVDGVRWLKILTDDGSAGNYVASRFEFNGARQ